MNRKKSNDINDNTLATDTNLEEQVNQTVFAQQQLHRRTIPYAVQSATVGTYPLQVHHQRRSHLLLELSHETNIIYRLSRPYLSLILRH